MLSIRQGGMWYLSFSLLATSHIKEPISFVLSWRPTHTHTQTHRRIRTVTYDINSAPAELTVLSGSSSKFHQKCILDNEVIRVRVWITKIRNMENFNIAALCIVYNVYKRQQPVANGMHFNIAINGIFHNQGSRICILRFSFIFQKTRLFTFFRNDVSKSRRKVISKSLDIRIYH